MYGATVDLNDASLHALGIHRLEIPVPFLEAGGPANVYVIEDADGRYTLFDTGIGTSDGITTLRGQAAERGLDLQKLSRILVSHGHLDHFGNAQMLSEESGARVFVHDLDREKVIGEARFSTLLRKHRGYFLKLGVPVETIELMQASADRNPNTIRYVEPARLGSLNEGDVLHFRHFDAIVKHMPGHTPGLVCLWAAQQRFFFADDHVLARVSPNPVIDFCHGEGATKFRALARYLEGAKWVRDQQLDAVLPGHGPAFTGHRELLDGLFEFYGRRQEKVLAKLREAPASIFELLPAVFPRRDIPRLVLMLSEVLANVEVLEDQGRVAVVDHDAEIVRYAAR
jgi:glyoxylase-like metal-dependent hydrolase (beta-lactamase superfamily II)